jgi:cell division septum initiation protein DivIVA
MDDLKERLRADAEWCAERVAVTPRQIGRDCEEALAHIEALEQRVSELEEALQEAVSYDDGPTYPWIVRAKQALAKARNEQVKHG